MIRIICRERDNRDMAAGAADAPDITYRTFDLDSVMAVATVEAWLREPQRMNDHYVTRTALGIEVRDDA